MKQLTECLPSFETSGQQKQALMQPNSTGTQHGATGFAVTVQPSERLAAMRWQEVESELARLLPPCVSSRLKQKQKTVFSEDGQADYVCTGCDLIEPERIDNHDLQASIILLSRATAPMPEAMLRLELSTLMAMTVGKRDDAEATMRIYARSLQEYPADCVMAAIRNSSKRAKFFPALSELLDDIEWRSKPRKYKLQCLRNEATRRIDTMQATHVANDTANAA